MAANVASRHRAPGPSPLPMPPSAPDRSTAPSPGRSNGAQDRLDPALRQRLLQEARTPWRGLRRALWLALTASAGLGLATMTMRLSSGDSVAASDLMIQLTALSLFGGLLWFDRNRDPAS
jgi:hypothetical protein